jgi:hypothetical protein
MPSVSFRGRYAGLRGVFADLVQDSVPPDPQPPQVGRAVGERPVGAGIIGQFAVRVEDRTDARRVTKERGGLADYPFVVVDPQSHRGTPSRRRASSAGTNVVCPVA